MKTEDKTKIEKAMKFCLYMIAKNKEYIENKQYARIKGSPASPEAILRNYLSTIADNACEVGQYLLLLGKKEEAMEYLRESAEYYEKTIRMSIELGGGEYPDFWQGIDTAIITGDEERMKNIASMIIDTDLSITYMYPLMKSYVLLQCAMILGKEEDVKKYLDELKTYEKTWKNHQDYEGQYDVYHGILTGNKEQFLKGIIRMLEIFKRRNAQLKFDPWFLEGTARIKLAQMNGLSIDVKNDIPKRFHTVLPMLLFED